MSELITLIFTSTIILGFISTHVVMQMLKKIPLYREDRKNALFDEKYASEFNKIREKDEREGKSKKILRVGGLTIMPTFLIVGLITAYLLNSTVMFIVVLLIITISLIGVYHDFVEIDLVKRKNQFGIIKRVALVFFIILIGGYFLQGHVTNTLTFLPIDIFSNIEVGIFFSILLSMWVVFWYAGSIIDGIDGLSGSVFLVLFVTTFIISFLQSNVEALFLSLISIGVLIPWLFVNYPPAKIYLTESGISFLIVSFSIVTFLLGTGVGGSGIWTAFLFGSILIITWMSNVIQLTHRKYLGRKLLKIAPIHHHFEAIGMNKKLIVLMYTLFTIGVSIIALLLI